MFPSEISTEINATLNQDFETRVILGLITDYKEISPFMVQFLNDRNISPEKLDITISKNHFFRDFQDTGTGRKITNITPYLFEDSEMLKIEVINYQKIYKQPVSEYYNTEYYGTEYSNHKYDEAVLESPFTFEDIQKFANHKDYNSHPEWILSYDNNKELIYTMHDGEKQGPFYEVKRSDPIYIMDENSLYRISSDKPIYIMENDQKKGPFFEAFTNEVIYKGSFNHGHRNGRWDNVRFSDDTRYYHNGLLYKIIDEDGDVREINPEYLEAAYKMDERLSSLLLNPGAKIVGSYIVYPTVEHVYWTLNRLS